MKRILLIAVGLLLVVIVGVGVYLYNSIDSIVKAGIEKYGTDITGTRVSVGSVDISLKSGRGTIRNIVVHNPKGFSSSDAFRLGEITIGLDVGSLNKDPIVIDEVRIAAPEVHVELDAGGQTNIGAIKDYADSYSAAPTSGRKQDAGYEKKFRIAKFSFEEGRVDADAKAMGGGAMDAVLPPVRLKDVGGSGGAAPGVIGKDVTRAFLGAAMGVVGREIRDRAIDKYGDNAKKALEKLLK